MVANVFNIHTWTTCWLLFLFTSLNRFQPTSIWNVVNPKFRTLLLFQWNRSFWSGTKTRWLQPEVLQLLYIYSQRKTSSRTETWRMKLCGKKSAATHQHGNFMHCENMQNENEKFKKKLCGMPFATQPTLCAVATCCLLVNLERQPMDDTLFNIFPSSDGVLFLMNWFSCHTCFCFCFFFTSCDCCGLGCRAVKCPIFVMAVTSTSILKKKTYAWRR